MNMEESAFEEEKEENGMSVESEVPVEPFNPKDIVIEVKPVTIETVLRRLNQGTLKLAPDFQRDAVWDLVRKSRLIESLMLNIPIPIFYVSADDKGVWSVVDGLQRLTAIKEFIVDKSYSLSELEFWGESFNNYKIDQLPPIQYNQIMETVFQFVIISPSTPDNVKRNIFKRINTGGMPLSAQEIRHALYTGKGTIFLKKLVSLNSFKKATCNSVKDNRMAAREIVLRLLAFFHFGALKYKEKADMDDFLCRALKDLNALDERYLTELEAKFSQTMVRCFELFGYQAFRISLGGKNRSPVNKALFEVVGAVIMQMDNVVFKKVFQKRDNIVRRLIGLIHEPLFYRSISRDSWKVTNVLYRYEKINQLFEEVVSSD